ncbi:class I SAM-dependent methyltransferase [Consotaella salsifontis]|uniref:Methyltransferase domain-containing protein n=1 Tax=Consotaella salsifontis TaxID=1365950 RepID=A0A1T4QMF4_9HYPH|nr:methyltransferase domain-containing protein [Consotaella salsifontis]SKA04651.1 Methyltransferase domain-containing protein [Consotaella salsifontis]
MAEQLFDRILLDRRRSRAAQKPEAGSARFLLDAVTQELLDRLSLVERQFETAVELAGHGGTLAEGLQGSGKVTRVLRLERIAAFIDGSPLSAVADEEALPLRDDSVDLIVSPLALHLTNDTPGALVQIRRALRPDGLFLAALLGAGSLAELRAALLAAESELSDGVSPRVAPFVDTRDAGGLLQRAGLALPVADLDRLTVRYPSMFELMADLRAMGMANMLTERRRAFTGKRLFLRAAEIYQERFADPDGRVRATFEIVYLSGWKPHESQQKPLRPGSGKVSLAAVLGDRSSDLAKD